MLYLVVSSQFIIIRQIVDRMTTKYEFIPVKLEYLYEYLTEISYVSE